MDIRILPRLMSKLREMRKHERWTRPQWATVMATFGRAHEWAGVPTTPMQGHQHA
ncbi:MAG TPA: hypothetical protein VHS06_12210 [Chloroflexota bacterium]|nr:hypothetical protein [Chloroflexota bacterium]